MNNAGTLHAGIEFSPYSLAENIPCLLSCGREQLEQDRPVSVKQTQVATYFSIKFHSSSPCVIL
jgi:hypothetical protein